MARSLYRFYLYFVSYILLWFAGVGLTLLIGSLLEYTDLQANYSYTNYYPGQPTTVQQTTFGIIMLVIAGGLLALHYWLIRRDVASDAGAGSSGIRAFFLNYAQFNAALTVLFAGMGTAWSLRETQHGDSAYSAAATLTGALIFLLLQLERRRAQPRPGAPIVFQRLHLYLGQFIILWGFIASTWTTALQDTADAITNQGRFLPVVCANSGAPYYPCSQPPAVSHVLTGDFAAMGLTTLAWIIYALLARGDVRSAIRQTAKFLGLAIGTSYTLSGIYQLADMLLHGPQQVGDYYNVNRTDTFAAPLIFGLVVLAVYLLSLRADASESPLGSEDTGSAILAVTAVIAAAPFWLGCGRLLYNIIEQTTQGQHAPHQAEWAAAAALIIAGVAYIPLALALAWRSHRMSTPGPRRGFALGLLAAGIIASATGLVMTIYALVTNALNAPLDNWQEVAKSGVAVLVIGLILAGLYGTIVVRDGYIKPPTPTQPATPAETPLGAASAPATTATEPTTIEEVLDALLAQRLTRDEAAARIHQFMGR